MGKLRLRGLPCLLPGLSPSQPYSGRASRCPNLSLLFWNEAVILTPSRTPRPVHPYCPVCGLHSCAPGSSPRQALQKLPRQTFRDGSRLSGCCSCLPGPPPLPAWVPRAWPLLGFPSSSWGSHVSTSSGDTWHPLSRLGLEARGTFWLFVRDTISSRRGKSPSVSDPAAPQLTNPKDQCSKE